MFDADEVFVGQVSRTFANASAPQSGSAPRSFLQLLQQTRKQRRSNDSFRNENMAAETGNTPLADGIYSPNRPIELSIGLSHSPGTRIYLHLTLLATSIVLFVTSAGIEAGQSGAAMGSFVYAMPDVSHEVCPDRSSC